MISLEWVKDYIDIADEDLKELAVKITKAGINVEKVITNHIDNLVIVDTNDALLIAKKDDVSDIKKIINKLKEKNKEEYI